MAQEKTGPRGPVNRATVHELNRTHYTIGSLAAQVGGTRRVCAKVASKLDLDGTLADGNALQGRLPPSRIGAEYDRQAARPAMKSRGYEAAPHEWGLTMPLAGFIRRSFLALALRACFRMLGLSLVAKCVSYPQY